MIGLILQVNLLIRCEAESLFSEAHRTKRRGNQVPGDVSNENQDGPERDIIRLSGNVALVPEVPKSELQQQLAMALRSAKG